MFKEDYRKELENITGSDDFKKRTALKMREACHKSRKPEEDGKGAPVKPASWREEEKAGQIYRIPVDSGRWKRVLTGTAAAVLLLCVGIGIATGKPRKPEQPLYSAKPSPTAKSEPTGERRPEATAEPIGEPFTAQEATPDPFSGNTPSPEMPREEPAKLIPDVKAALEEYGDGYFSPFDVWTETIDGREYIVFSEEGGPSVSIQNETNPGEERQVKISCEGKEKLFSWQEESGSLTTLQKLRPYTGDFKGTGEEVLVFCPGGNPGISILDLDTFTDCGINTDLDELYASLEAEWKEVESEGRKLCVRKNGFDYCFIIPNGKSTGGKAGRDESPAQLELGTKVELKAGYSPDQDWIEARFYVAPEGYGVFLGYLSAGLVWDGKQFRYQAGAFYSSLEYRREAVPAEAGTDRVLNAVLLGSLEEDNVKLDEAEWISADDQKRLKEVGLEEEDMPNGFLIYNEEEEYQDYKLSPKTAFYVLDENNVLTECTKEAFLQKKSSEGIEYCKAGIKGDRLVFLAEQYVP